MDLKELQRSWNELATRDAMWAVLTGPLAAGREWDQQTFFRTGVEEIADVLARVGTAGAAPGRSRALDFGCGVGRLTQALAGEFEQVDGVDIAPAMIEQARSLNRFGDRCRFHLNEADDLSLFPLGHFDFVYSSITLQHMPPQYSRRYIAEFFRVARPGGVVVFQLPAEPVAIHPPQTRRAEPLPREAARARITAPPALRCAPGAPIPLRAMVRNDSPHTWPWMGAEDGRFALRLGNHWRGRFLTVKFDDARVEMPHDVAPGQEIEMLLAITAPATAGRYTLELDMVQEHVRWFADAGSPKARIKVHVDPALRAGEVEGLPSRMEMHGIARPDVEALVAATGATLIAVDENDAPGPGWTSYRYVAAK